MVAEKNPVQTSFPVEIKDEALRIFLEKDAKIQDIVDELNKKHEGLGLTYTTVRSWISNNNWTDIRAEIAVQTNKSIIDSEVARRKASTKRQLEDYDLLLDTAKAAYPTLDWKSAGEAAKVVDVAIKGQRTVQAGILHVEFVQDIFDAIVEVVKDEDIRSQIGSRLKLVIAKWDERTGNQAEN